jgi:hypothetical protein
MACPGRRVRLKQLLARERPLLLPFAMTRCQRD